MFAENLFNISEFAKISGVSRQTLIYYDKIGLFSPVTVGENRYRMYSHNQIGIISIICILSDLGVPLKEIMRIVKNISPETTEKVLTAQLSSVQKKIKKLSLLSEMVELRLSQIRLGEKAVNRGGGFSLVEVTENIPLFIGKKINCDKNNIPDSTMVEFFDDCEKKGLPLVFALGYIKREADLAARKENIVSAMCFRLKDKIYANGFIPKGKYAVGYAFGDYGKTDYIYDELFDFLDKNNLQIDGDAYEEYLHDELVQKNADGFVMQLSVKVDVR